MLRRFVAISLLAFAACARSPAPPPPPTPAPTISTTVRAGTSGNYPPFSTWTEHGPSGFAPTLLGAFARAEHAEISWAHFDWPELGEGMRTARFDVVADGITITAQRSILGRFTVPVARGGAILLLRRPAWAKASDDVRALDRSELRVVVNAGGHLERVTRSLFHAAQIKTMHGNVGLHEALAHGEADAAMTNTFEAPLWAEGLTGIERVGPLGRDWVAFWLAPQKSELAERFDAFLLAEEANGDLAAARKHTLGEGAGPETARPLAALFAATRERLSLMPFVAAVKKRAGLPITDERQEARVVAAGTEAVTKAARAAGVDPPSAVATEAFYRAQIAAAKAVEEHPMDDNADTYSLDKDLRPAIARVSAKMAFLVVRVPRGTTYEQILSEARNDLEDVPLDTSSVERIAHALTDLVAR